MKAVFISDAHLRSSQDARYRRLLRFFSDVLEGKISPLVTDERCFEKKPAIDDLFILGDFFDYWFCDKNNINPEFEPIIDKLVQLQKAGIRIHLAEGNHDFFLAEYFQDVLGMVVYEEWACLELDRLNILIAHGDTADQSDRFYLWFRRLLRSTLFYKAQQLLPCRARWAIAGFTSRASKEMNNDNDNVLLKKMMVFALKKLKGNYDAMIVGHCHQPVLQELDIEGKKKTFVSLGDWTRHFSYLYLEDGKFSLCHYSGKEKKTP